MLWLQRRVSGRWTFLVKILSSCCGHGGCHWHFLAPLTLCHSPCGFLYNLLCYPPTTPLRVCVFLAVMAGDCGDEISSKSKPQPAGITSCVNPANLLSFRCFFHFSNFRTRTSFKSLAKPCNFVHHTTNFEKILHFCSSHPGFIFFQCSIVPLLVLARPDDCCGSFFFFLKGNSFPSASTLSRTCSRAYPPRYCLPEISFPMELLAVW